MKIQIHTRHADLAEDFKTIAEEKLNSMERFSVVIDRVEVEVLHENNPHQGKHKHKVILTSHGSMIWLHLMLPLRPLRYRLEKFMSEQRITIVQQSER